MHPTSPGTLRPNPLRCPPTPAVVMRSSQARATAIAMWTRKRVASAGFAQAAAFEPPPIDREITVAEGITVKELSEKLGIKANLVIKKSGG